MRKHTVGFPKSKHNREKPTAVLATCFQCGDVELEASELIARLCLDNDQEQYRFTCPTCSMVVNKPAKHETINLLIACGAAFETWTLPEELFETKVGPPIGHDEIIDLHQALKSHGPAEIWAELE